MAPSLAPTVLPWVPPPTLDGFPPAAATTDQRFAASARTMKLSGGGRPPSPGPLARWVGRMRPTGWAGAQAWSCRVRRTAHASKAPSSTMDGLLRVLERAACPPHSGQAGANGTQPKPVAVSLPSAPAPCPWSRVRSGPRRRSRGSPRPRRCHRRRPGRCRPAASGRSR